LREGGFNGFPFRAGIDEGCGFSTPVETQFHVKITGFSRLPLARIITLRFVAGGPDPYFLIQLSTAVMSEQPF